MYLTHGGSFNLNELFKQFKYPKIRDISPGLIVFQRYFLGGLKPGGGLIIGGGGLCVREKE